VLLAKMGAGVHTISLLLRARSLALMESALGDLYSLTVLTTCVKSRFAPS
jgi:hypothetical protein